VSDDQLLTLLREMRDNQREAIALQKDHMATYAKQLDRVDRINEKAEALQVRAGKAAKVILWVILPSLAVVVLMMAWPYVRYLSWMLWNA
jgi:ABC-type uncharacterized transport system involved in gliding motility auxiliary subunit